MISEARIREVMREQRCDYRAACAWLGKRGGRRARRVATEGQREAAVRKTWSWKRDFS